MHDATDITEAELAALADGSLPAERRDELARRAAASPELTRTLATQRAALAAVQATASERAPQRLHAFTAALAEGATERERAPRRRRPARRWSLSLAGALAAVLAVLVLVLGGTPDAPSVAQAAQLALAPPSSAAPRAQHGSSVLEASVDGVAYPYWRDSTGWRAVGSRRGALRGRMVNSVVYANRSGARIGYAIAAGSSLRSSGGRPVRRNGVDMRVLHTPDGAVAVTWQRKGHTCVLASRDVGADVLLGLASGTTR